MFTPTKRNAILTLGMLLLLVLLSACATRGSDPGSQPAEPDTHPAEVSAEGAANFPGIDPTDVVQRFYDDWLEYGRYTGNPLVSEYYKESGYLSAAGVARIEGTRGPQGWPADPVLCAQDLPESVTVESSTIDGDRASVLAVTSWDTRLGIDLVQVEGQWQIDSITCLGR